MDATTKSSVHTGIIEFRDYIAELERTGQLLRIADPVDPLTEVGAIMRWANENYTQAQLFTNVKGAMPGSALVGGLYSTRERVAMVFGLPPDTDYHDLVDHFGEAIKKRLPPKIVDQGACQQNLMLGNDVDLSRFPIPKLHPQDGAPYIGTLNIGVCKDPDSDWVNWGTYRGMVHDKQSTGLLLLPMNQGGMLMMKYHERKQVMEYAQFYGGDPIFNIVASAGIPYGVSEVDVAGGIRGVPIPLVKCKTVNLHVPANAEVVLEGTLAPGDTKAEGPFGEYPGYVVSGVVDRPVYRLSAITYRDNPVLPSTCLGVPTDESLIWLLEVAATVKETLKAKGIPVVKVATPEFSGGHCVVVSTKTPYAGIPQLISSVVWSDRNASVFPYCIVVNDDIDPANMGEVFHALCTKCNPIKDIHIRHGSTNSPLTPYLPRSPLKEKGYGGGHVLFDCTWPIEWDPQDIPHRLAFNNTYPDDVKQKVLADVKRWGFKSLR
ncbi:UbiD family decarboxylase [Immundisolibacter sp.]|uniref:UbiD family decarboxylase n=1 Tax=Immundisolibacter sp. TaxID=1934948 RepID=UPI0035651FD5